MTKQKIYSWKKTLKKFGIDAAIMILTGTIAVWQQDMRYFAIIPFLKATLDILKHS